MRSPTTTLGQEWAQADALPTPPLDCIRLDLTPICDIHYKRFLAHLVKEAPCCRCGVWVSRVDSLPVGVPRSFRIPSPLK